jgi:cytidylate kinase
MAQLGGVVLVGRGGNFILGQKRGFHIRVVCPKEKRIANLMKYKKFSLEDATACINQSDTEKQAFARKLFRADNNDPRYYDLIINSEYVDFEELVPGLIESAKSKMNKLSRLAREPQKTP